MIPAQAVILYLIVGGLVFGITMWFRKDMRRTFLSYNHSGRFSMAAMAILAWWMTVIYIIKRKPDEEAK